MLWIAALISSSFRPRSSKIIFKKHLRFLISATKYLDCCSDMVFFQAKVIWMESISLLNTMSQRQPMTVIKRNIRFFSTIPAENSGDSDLYLRKSIPNLSQEEEQRFFGWKFEILKGRENRNNFKVQWTADEVPWQQALILVTVMHSIVTHSTVNPLTLRVTGI